MRVAYLGTSAFAAGILARLAESAHDVALVITRPDRPAGRGRHLAAPPVADAARTLGLALEQPADVNGAVARARIASAASDVLVVCAFGALIKEPLLSAHTVLNVHPSLLPRWRGAAPVERAIMAGDRETGVCIMRLTAGLDTGPVCLRGVEAIAAEDTYGSLAPRLQQLGGDLLLRALDAGPEGWAWEEQPEEGVTYAEKIGPADRTLDPAAAPAEQERVVRALAPHIGARLALDDGTFLGVQRARVAEGGALELVEVQPPGGRPMAYEDYVRGR